MEGLQVRPELNECQGILGVFITETGNWPVILSDESVVLIKAENLRSDAVRVGGKRKPDLESAADAASNSLSAPAPCACTWLSLP